MAKVTGLVLASAPSEEPQFVPGLPGMWSTSEAVVPATLGMTLGDLRDLLDEAGVEYREVKVDPPVEAEDDEPEPEESSEPAASEEADG